MPPPPSPAQRLRKAFEQFLTEAQKILLEIEATEPVANSLDPKILAIKHAVASYYHIPVTLLDARIRREEVVWPRHVAMYLLTESTNLTWRQVAAAFGRTHATAIEAYRAVKNGIETSPRRKREVEDLQRQFPSIH